MRGCLLIRGGGIFLRRRKGKREGTGKGGEFNSPPPTVKMSRRNTGNAPHTMRATVPVVLWG